MSKPGVGYAVRPGTLSHAGGGHGQPPVPMDLTADPWAGRDPRSPIVDQAAMARRYGQHWQSGAPGPHSNVYEDGLRERFALRKATWPVNFEEWDGIPIGREVNDAFFSKDSRVLPPPPDDDDDRECEAQLAEARRALAAAQQALEASRGQVTALAAQVEGLNVRVQALKDVPADVTKTVQVLRNAGPKLEIKTGLKAAFRRLEQWILKRGTL